MKSSCHSRKTSPSSQDGEKQQGAHKPSYHSGKASPRKHVFYSSNLHGDKIESACRTGPYMYCELKAPLTEMPETDARNVTLLCFV